MATQAKWFLRAFVAAALLATGIIYYYDEDERKEEFREVSPFQASPIDPQQYEGAIGTNLIFTVIDEEPGSVPAFDLELRSPVVGLKTTLKVPRAYTEDSMDQLTWSISVPDGTTAYQSIDHVTTVDKNGTESFQFEMGPWISIPPSNKVEITPAAIGLEGVDETTLLLGAQFRVRNAIQLGHTAAGGLAEEVLAVKWRALADEQLFTESVIEPDIENDLQYLLDTDYSDLHAPYARAVQVCICPSCFAHPSPDGDVDQQTKWIQSKHWTPEVSDELQFTTDNGFWTLLLPVYKWLLLSIGAIGLDPFVRGLIRKLRGK